MKTIIIILAAMMAMPFAASADAMSVSESTSLTDSKPSKKKKAELKEVTFHVHLHCANCVKKVEENIAFEKGVKDLKVSLDNQTVYIKYDAAKTSEAALKAAIEELGYPVSAGHDHGHHHGHAH